MTSYEIPTNYTIELELPKAYSINSNLYKYTTKRTESNHFYFTGRQKTDVIFTINKVDQFKIYKTKKIAIHTDILDKDIDYTHATNYWYKELSFLEKYLGAYPS